MGDGETGMAHVSRERRRSAAFQALLHSAAATASYAICATRVS
jgi:hypothetical protein